MLTHTPDPPLPARPRAGAVAALAAEAAALAAAHRCGGLPRGGRLRAPAARYVLVMAAFGLSLDAATSMWPKGDGLTKYRQ